MFFLALVRMTLKMRGVTFAVAVKVLKVLEVCILVKHLTVYMHALNILFLYGNNSLLHVKLFPY